MVHRGMLSFNFPETKEASGNLGLPKKRGGKAIVKKWLKPQRGRGAIANSGKNR